MYELDPTDIRVLGALIEKELATPDNYPLSLNALTLACNQSSNRDPVMRLDDASVVAATDRLRRLSFVRALQKSDSRVLKYSHLLADALDLDRRELAVLCVLMLRGPQTVGELKVRTARLAEFESIADVDAVLTALATRDGTPLVQRLARRPGQKEARIAHLFAPVADADAGDAAAPAPASAPPAPAGADRVAALETAVEELRSELADIRRHLEEFRRQFQ